MQKIITYPLLLGFIILTRSSLAQNNAISLNGTTDYISTTLSLVPASGPFTVEFWAYVPAFTSGNHMFVSQGPVGNAFYIGYDAAGNILAGDGWGGTTTAQIEPGQWNHIAMVYNPAGDSTTIYVNDNDEADGSTSYTFGTGGGAFQIGQFNSGSFAQGSIDELRIWNVVREADSIKANWYPLTTPTAEPGLVAYYNMNAVTAGQLTDLVTSTNDATLMGAASLVSSPIETNTNGLAFDGSAGNYVTIPNNPQYGSIPLTVEFWVNPGTITGTADMIGMDGLTSGTSYNRFIFYLTPSKIGMQAGTNTSEISLPSNFTPAAWNHMAFEIDDNADTTGVFVNGVYAGRIPQGSNTAPNALGQPLVIGTDLETGTPVNTFPGSIDEVRIWTDLQTQADILNYMGTTLTGTEPALRNTLGGLFSFDQGIAGGDNSFFTTAFDNTINNNHGVMTSFAMTGAVSNFVSHPITLPVTFANFTATDEKTQALLRWQTAQEENSRDFSIERSTDGANYVSIGTVAAAGNSSLPLSYSYVDPAPAGGVNYYRLKETDLDDRSMYSVIRSLNFIFTNARELVWYRTGDKAIEVDYRDGGNETYSIYDLNGRTIQQGQLSAGKLYLNQVASGMYSVRVIRNDGTELNAKVIVQ